MFKIHYSTYIFLLLASLSASFIPCLIIFTLIIIHEIGHYIFAKILNIEVNNISIYPLGGITKMNIPLNYPQIKELIILIAGPTFQHLAYLLLKLCLPNYTEIIYMYHYQILIFNLLPIYPLDGGKILNLLFTINIPYKKSLYLSTIISYMVLLLILIKNIKQLKINILVMLIFLLYKIIKENKKITSLYEKFILERYLNNYRFKDTKLINNKYDFYRNKSHIIKENNKYYYEKDYLYRKYKKIKKTYWLLKYIFAII